MRRKALHFSALRAAVDGHAGGLALGHNHWLFHSDIKCGFGKIQKISVDAVVVAAITAMAVMG